MSQLAKTALGILIVPALGLAACGGSECSIDTATIQVAVDQALSDNGGSLPAFLKSSTGGANMVTSGDLQQLKTNAYIHIVPTGCQTFTLTTTTAPQGSTSVSVYVVTGR